MKRKRIAAPSKGKVDHLPNLHVKRSAELWLDRFENAMDGLLALENYTSGQWEKLIVDAREIADRALDEYEKRWPGVKL